MADAASIGANFSEYSGNVGLGGGTFGVVQIDTRPLQQLAAYTMYYNKAEYEQRQKDIEAKAKQLADLTAYDLNSAIPIDRDRILKGYNNYFDFVQKNPTVLDYKSNPNGWLEYNKKKNEFENQLQGAKVRSLLYKKRQEEIDSATNVKEKERLQKDLDNEANSTDLATPLRHTQLYDVTPVEVVAPPSFKIDVTNKGVNAIGTRTIELPDMASIEAQSAAALLGFSKLPTDVNSPEYRAMLNSGKLEPIESSKNISTILQNPKYKQPEFRNPDGTLNMDLVIKDNASNGLVTGILTTVKQYNDKMDEMTSQIEAGYFKDKLGKDLSFGSGGLNKNNYRKIDLSDGFTPDEILKVRIFGKAKPISYSTKIDQTNEGIQKQRIAQDYAQLNETVRHNKATENLASEDNKLNAEKWKASQVGGETQINGAFVRGTRIYDDLKKLADKSGVISPDKIRQLNVEQLKYLGIEAPEERDEQGNITFKGGFKPLSFDKDKEYAIQLVNGDIKVLKPKDGEKRLIKKPSGSYEGLFDPQRSTNVHNMRTNILNEELKNAGAKELNSYMGIDVINGITTNTSGGSTSVSGSKTTKVSDAQKYLQSLKQ